MTEARKEFTFDLNTQALKEVFGEKSYTKAYNELYDFFVENMDLNIGKGRCIVQMN